MLCSFQKSKSNQRSLNQLKAAESVSFTSDIWTDDNSSKAFISLTGHYLNTETMKRHNPTLATRTFQERHTAENISKMLDDLVDEWKLEGKCHVLVHDNAANMVAGVRRCKVAGVGCFIHLLQLCINDAILSQWAIADILVIARKIAGHFAHSVVANEKLAVIQEELKLPKHKIMQDVKTRWNSTYYMLERLYEQRQAVTTYGLSNDINILTNGQYALIANILQVLKPFEELTVTCSEENCTISVIIPSVLMLVKYLGKRQKDAGVQTLKEELKKSVTSRFIEGRTLSIKKKELTIATLLDPRYKEAFFQDEDAKSVKMDLIDALVEYEEQQSVMQQEREEEPIDVDIDELNSSGSSSTEDIVKTSHDDYWQCFDEITSSKPDFRTSNGEDEMSSGDTDRPKKRHPLKAGCFLAEVDKYLSLPRIDRKEDPLHWWFLHKSEFKVLMPMVFKYLSAPPSSVNSERMFSAAGHIYLENRNKLAPEHAEQLIFLMKN